MGVHDPRRFWQLLDELCTERRSGVVALAAKLAAVHCQVTPQYLSALRSGKKSNPSFKLLHALGAVFDVHPAWFLGGRRERAPGTVTSDSFATRLHRLFETVRPADGNPYSVREIVSLVPVRAATLPGTGWTLSAPTLTDLCKGSNDDPSLRQILVIAVVFGVEPWYFFDDDYAREADAQATADRLATVLELDVRAVLARSFAGEEIRRLEPHVMSAVITRLARAYFPAKADQIERLLTGGTPEEPAMRPLRRGDAT